MLDGWTSSNHHSYFSFVVITPERKEYVIKVQDYSKNSHTGLFTAQEIKKVLTGPRTSLIQLTFEFA